MPALAGAQGNIEKKAGEQINGGSFHMVDLQENEETPTLLHRNCQEIYLIGRKCFTKLNTNRKGTAKNHPACALASLA